MIYLVGFLISEKSSKRTGLFRRTKAKIGSRMNLQVATWMLQASASFGTFLLNWLYSLFLRFSSWMEIFLKSQQILIKFSLTSNVYWPSLRLRVPSDDRVVTDLGRVWQRDLPVQLRRGGGGLVDGLLCNENCWRRLHLLHEDLVNLGSFKLVFDWSFSSNQQRFRSIIQTD